MFDRLKKIPGAAIKRQSTRPAARADDLADMVLKEPQGRAEGGRLGELWGQQPAVLVCLRHYGCVFCRAHAVQWHRDQAKSDAAGVRLAVVGQGTPRHAEHFIEEYGLDGMTVLVDPDRKAY